MNFVWLLMSNSELLRIKNKQKTTYKKQKTASSYKIAELSHIYNGDKSQASVAEGGEYP